jgi:hypothetical protein
MKQDTPVQQTCSPCQKILLKHVVLWYGNNWDRVPLDGLWRDMNSPKKGFISFQLIGSQRIAPAKLIVLLLERAHQRSIPPIAAIHSAPL